MINELKILMSLEKKRILDTWKLVKDALTPFKGQVNLCPISIITLTTVHVMSRLIYSLSLVSYAVHAILGRKRQHRLEGRQQYLVLFGAATSSGPGKVIASDPQLTFRCYEVF